MDPIIKVVADPVRDETALEIVAKLNAVLQRITGDPGSKNAALGDFCVERAVFLIAFHGNEAVGCGGFRPVDNATAEVKRMFSIGHRHGVGKAILQALESRTFDFGYKRIVLETRSANVKAVTFYLNNGYTKIENYGVYQGRNDAVCFQKILTRCEL